MGERFATAKDVQRHWRVEQGDPYRISETKDEAANRRAAVWRREERASEVELVGEHLVIARMDHGAERYRWGVFHAGTAQPVLMLDTYEHEGRANNGVRARTRAEALDQWRDTATGEPFDWTSEGLIDRLRSPYGYGMLERARGRDPEARWAGTAPADVTPWPTDDGQEYAYDGSPDKVTVYDPDGLLIALGESKFDPKTKKSAFLGEMRDGRCISGRRSDDFVQNAVWQHRIAQLEPGARDGLWIYYQDHRPIVHGTDRYAADWPDTKVLLRSAGFTWSGFAKAYVTAGTTRAIARAQSVDRLARALYAQGRMVEIRADEDRLRGVLTPAAPAPAAASAPVPVSERMAGEASTAAAAPEAAAAPAPAVLTPQDLTDEQLAAEIQRLEEERRGAAYGGARHKQLDEQIAPLKQEHEQRQVAQVEARPDPAGMEDGEITVEREALAAALGRPVLGYESRTPLAVARRERVELLRVEQARRTAAELEARPPVVQLTDEDLKAEGAQLVKDRHRRPPEAADAFGDRVTAVGAEIADRRLHAWGKQPPAEDLDDVELTEALESLYGLRLSDTEFAGSTRDKERVEKVFTARKHVLQEEVKQRDEKAFRTLLETDGRIRLKTLYNGTTNVRIDNRSYGELIDNSSSWRARLWRGRDITREEAWRTDALRWLIGEYEKDPETRDTRTWGAYVAVELPPSFVDQLTTHFSDLTLSGEAEKYLIRQVSDSSRSQSFDVTGKKTMVHALAVPQRALPVLERMGRRLVDRLDEELDSDDRKIRDRAKRARPNVLRALDDFVALMESRGLEPLGPDNASAEAPQDGEADSERVREDGPPALGDVPATGAVADAGPGGVLPGAGDGRAGTDRGADRGEDGRSDAGDGPPAAGGQAEGGPADGPGAGAEGDRAPGAGGGQPGRRAAPLVFRPASQEDLAPAGERAKAAANLEAARVLQRVREDKRPASADEQQVLARWSGWGSVPEIFAARPLADDPVFGPGGEREGGHAAAAARWESFADVRDPLRVLLDDAEWRAAAASTLSAHYTPPEITSALWQALADLGFDGGEVLEPGSGAGVTFGTAPESARLTGVEIDPTSAAISRLLAPGVTVLNESFADTVAPDGSFDGVVGNVPFARVSLYDPKHNRGRHRLHNHFLVKSVALTRPGGVVALITSRHTLDAESAAARDELFEMADLLGAVRLPNKAFARSAGTDVVTDILILRRRMDGEEPLDRSWLASSKRPVGEHRLRVNDYFAAHPEHMLGTLTSRMGAHGPEVAVDGDPDVGEALRTVVRQITDSAVLARRWYAPHPEGPYRPRLQLKPAADLQDFTGRLSADVEGKLWQTSGDGELVAVELPAKQHAQLAALVELKDLVRGLNELDRSGSDLALADAHRRLTKEAYARYVAAHGPLSRPGQQQNATTQTDDGASVAGLTAWGYFLNDPQAYEVLALEMWEADTETVHVSEILDHAPATRRSVLGQHTDDPQQALDAVVAERGKVDLAHIAWMLQVDEDEARRRLARSVFTDPLTGELLYSADYLSGDVRTKLEIARQAARRDAAFQVNVAELERVLPREMLPGQFAVRLGAAWLPEDLVQQFFREYLGDAHLTVQHSGNGNWHILKGRGLSEEDEVKHSAGGLHPLALLSRVLNGGSMTGRPADDEEAARAVRVKAEEWRDAFEAWVLDDSVRAARAADVYNRQMNNRVVRDFTGSRPSLTGLDPDFDPYDHQLAAAARMAHERCLVLSHVVGAGKTGALAIGMMAMKNTGQINKPMVAVPNYLVEQWEGEVRRLFPAARILTLTSADLADGKRDRMFQYVRANSFDLIIMSHSLFDSIPLSPEFYEFYNDEELRKMDAQILHERRREGKSISLKQLQERRQQHEETLKAKAASVRTPGQVYFDDLGLDFVAIDEAHEYKNLAVRSKIPGARVSGSAKAQHLHAVLEWARRNKPAGPMGCLATGTPLSNAIGELHTLLLLANPDLLRNLGIEEFDAFATMYGKMVERLEMTVDGKGFKSVERFASFHSVNSLLRQLWRPVVDYKDEEDLGLPLPSIRGGEPELMLVPATAAQEQLMQKLGERYEAYHLGEVDKSEDNPLSINTDARVIALDPRLIDAEAEPGNKLRLLADRVAAEYHQTKDNRYTYSTEDLRPHPVPGGLQMVFLNQGTPGGKNRGNFNAYQEFKDLLVARDVPAEKIDFIHDASRADQRRKLVARANHGGSNVLIGSTQRMGKGLNAQNRCTTVYHVDPDFRPADMKQKDGRGRRKGNQNKVVGIVWVATENTFDSRMYGTLATKAKGFDQVYKARLDAGSDEIQEVDEAIVPFEEAMAIISGNPYLIAQGDLRKRLRTLTLDQNNRATQRAIVFKKVQQLNKDIDALTWAINERGAVLPSLRPVLGDDFEITLGGVTYTKHKDAATPLTGALTGVLGSLPEKRAFTPEAVIGQLGGLNLAAVAFREDGQDVPFVRVHLDGLPGSLQRFDAVELSILKGETLLRRLTKTLTEAPERQTEDEGNLTAKQATRDELLVYSEQLRGDVPGLGRARERLSLVDGLVAAQIAVNKAGEPTKDEAAAETEKRKQAIERRELLQRQLDQFDAAAPAEASAETGEALLDLDELRRRAPGLLSPQQKESEAAILRAHITVHGDPDGTVAARLAELGMPLAAEPVVNEGGDGQRPAPEPPAVGKTESTKTGAAGPGDTPRELIDGFGGRLMFGHIGGQRPTPEPPGESDKQPTEQPMKQPETPAETAPAPPGDAALEDKEDNAPAPDGDEYGTADLYETFGLTKPARVPLPDPPDGPDPEEETEDSAAVPAGQITFEEAQPQAAGDGPRTKANSEKEGTAADQRNAAERADDLNAAAVLRHYEPVLQMVGLSAAETISYLSSETARGDSRYASGNPFERLMDDISRRADRVRGISQQGRAVTMREVSEARDTLHRHLTDLAVGLPDVRYGREEVFGIDLAGILAAPHSRFALPDDPHWRLAAAVPTGKVVVAHDPQTGYAVFNTYRRRKAGEVLRDQRLWWDRDAVPEGVWRPRTNQSEAEQRRAVRELLAALTAANVDHAVHGEVFHHAEDPTQPDQPPVPQQQNVSGPEAEEANNPRVADGQTAPGEVRPEAAGGGQDTVSEGRAAKDDGRKRLTSTDGRLTFTLLEVAADAGLAPHAVAGYQRQLSEFTAVVETKNEQAAQTPAERAEHLARWRRTFKVSNGLEPFRPLPSLRLTPRADGPGLTPAEYGIGSWLTWRDGRSGEQVTGQVMGPGPAGNTWFVSTDRTGHTGEYHVLSRSGKKATGYTYSLNGAATDLRPADGPGQQLPLETLPQVDAVPARPVTSYADWVPTTYGLAPVREPIPVTVGEMGPRFDPAEVAFDVVADGIPFVVRLSQNDETLTSTFVPRVESDGEVVVEFGPLESRGEAVDFCVGVAREAREMADKPLYAQNRNYDFALANEGVCGRCSRNHDDNDVKELYRVDGSDPECIHHLYLRCNAAEEDIAVLARARRIWAVRTDPEPEPADTAPPADTEKPAEQPAAPETVTAVALQDPHEVARESLQGGNRITAVISGRSIEWDGDAWGVPVPETVTVTGTVYPGYRDYRRDTMLLDAEIRGQSGQEVTAAASVFVRLLPAQVQLIPAEHRDDLRPETRTVAQVRLGDLIAEGGARGEAVTELRFGDNNRRGSVMGFSTRDVAKGTPNGFALKLTDKVQVVPRERRAPQDVAAVFGRYSSHNQVALETQRTYDLHAAVAEVTSRVWPDGTGPQDEIQALSRAVGAIDPTARGVDAYRANAEAMEAAGTAAAALFAATDDDILNRYVGLSLHRLRQHLDVQAHRLHADVAHLIERAAAAPAEKTNTTEESASPAPEEQRAPDQPTDRTREGEDVASQDTGETEQLGLFGGPPQDAAAPDTAPGSGDVGAQLQAALIEGETIVPEEFTDRREPVAGWILTTAGGHTFRLRPVSHYSPDRDRWEAGHDADGSYWWNANEEDRPLTAVLARIREDSATRTRFASLWARYGHLMAQPPQFETTTDRVQLEEGVFLVRRFGSIGLIASCRWGWEHLTDPDGAQGRTGEDWSRRGPDTRQYVAEWRVWHLAQDAIPNGRLRVVAQLTDDMADTPDAYCDASAPFVGKCSAKRSGARYTVAVDTDQGSELGHYTVCARCLSHRLLSDEDRGIRDRDVQDLARDLAKGDPKVCALHWKQWPDRIAELAGQMLSTALNAGKAAPWPAQALTAQLLAEACEAGDGRALREARAEAKAAGGDAKTRKRAVAEVAAARKDRATLITRRGATHGDAANEADRLAVAIFELAGSYVPLSGATPEPATSAPNAVNVNTLTVSPQVLNGEPSSYQFTVTGPGLTVGEYHISHDAQGKGARGIMWQAWWHGVEPSGRWDVINIGSGEGESAALAAVAEHAAKAGGDLAAGFSAARRMRYDAGLWLLPEVGESEAIQYHPDGSWTITAETGVPYTVRQEWRGRTANGDLAPLLIEDSAGTLIASCTAVDSYMSAWEPMLDRLRLHAAAAADGVSHATAVTRGGPTQEWVEAWCVCSWTERADVAEYADRVPAGEAMALAHRQETTAAAEAPAAAELPELDVVLLDVDVPPLDPAEPYETDEEAQADIGRLSEAFARWEALPTVQRYYEADRQQRPDGAGDPANPVAQLAAAYRDAERSLRDGPVGSPDDLVRRVHTVAVWSGALAPVVDEDLRGPLAEVGQAATLLASRSQATVEAFEAELAALSTNPAEESAAAETAPAEQAPTADDEPKAQEDTTEPGSGEPAADTGPAEAPAAVPATAAPETDGVTDDEPEPQPQEAPEPQAAAEPPQDTATDSDPEPERSPDPQEPAATVPDEGMHEARREAAFLEQDRSRPTDSDQQTPEPGTAAAPPELDPDPSPASEAAPGDETARDASEEPTMTTPPTPQTDAPEPDEQITEEPPAPQRYADTVTLAGDPGYRLRLSGLDGQPVDSREVLRGDLVIATLHPGPEGGWFARLTSEPADSTHLADELQEAAAHAAVMHSAFTGDSYGPPAGAAVGDETRQRVDVLRATLRDVALQHREAVALAAARAYPDVDQSERFRALVGALDGLAAAVAEDYGSQQMTQRIDDVQAALNAWGNALPTDVSHPVRREMAYPLAHLLYDSRRMHDHVQDTLAAVQAERGAAPHVRNVAGPGSVVGVQAGRVLREETAADPRREQQQAAPESGTSGVPESQSTGSAQEEAVPAPAGAGVDAPGPGPSAPSDEDGPARDAAVGSIRQTLENTPQAARPDTAMRSGELPLWVGTDTPPADTAVTEPPAGPLDVRAEFQPVLEAWRDHVPPGNGTAQDLVASLDADLLALQHAFDEAVGPSAPTAPPAAADQDAAAPAGRADEETPPPARQQASDVNAALQQADTHATGLQNLPEWQQISTVRGAFGHLVRVMRERAGEHFDRLMGDTRVGEFFRKVSIAACEKVAGWAQAAADRLRRRGEVNGPGAPAADALRSVADAATAYASPSGSRSGPPPAPRDGASITVDIPEMQKLGEALSRPLPGARDGRGARVSTAAARGKSTTRRGTKKPTGTTKKPGAAAEQAGHLRRGGAESQQQNHKPTQR
ncbi:hypothetical protein [Streptomyces olivaceus]|uniref:hypothetical protein n=1 Tax=Streptomyces olivaceus TaxID=47716 RepID=UPI00249157C1|nr:hypothetical protein [Streptomyces olivaceus]